MPGNVYSAHGFHIRQIFLVLCTVVLLYYCINVLFSKVIEQRVD